MKRFLSMFLLVLALMAGVGVLSVSADSAATRVDVYSTVNIDGDCLVSVTVSLHLESMEDNLTFPLPANASDVTMNGSSVSTTRSGSVLEVSLTRATGGMPGDYPVRFEYTLPKAVRVNEDGDLMLTMPLLCGFSYPVYSLNYTVTVPAEVTGRPEFYSTYRQNSIASDLNNNINGSMITGSSKSTLNDHEAITMTMVVPREMFPSVSTYIRNGNPELVPMGILAGAALLYWLIFLSTLPPRRERNTVPTEGTTAGEIGCRLTLCGADLSMMVMTWAQLGYLLIHLDDNGRVLLHKRMDMGNERTLFEVRMFQDLFGNRRTVDCGALHYARQCKKAAGMIPGEKVMLRSSRGNPKLFRGLLCLAQLFCGICVAMNMTNIGVLQVLLSILFGAFGLVSAWQIQGMAYRTHLRDKRRIIPGLLCCAAWLLLGFLCGEILIPAGAVAVQALMGFLAAYGGRRSELNRQEVGLILGLRRYLRKLEKEEAYRLSKVDPEYFFRMAPYAQAMGVLKPFAKAFGKRKFDQCPYLVSRVHGRRTALEWAAIMEQTAAAMDARYRQLLLEKWAAIRLR